VYLGNDSKKNDESNSNTTSSYLYGGLTQTQYLSAIYYVESK